MNRIQLLLTLLALLPFSHAAAQVTDFAPVGAKWYYDNHPSVPPPWGIPALVVEVTGEELVQGQLCRKLEGMMLYGGLDDPAYVFSRNDSVFFFSSLTQQFELLYDFTAEAGDSWVIRGLNVGGLPDSSVVVVDSVGHRIVGDDTLAVWYVSYEERYDWGDEIIEKVGNICFLSPDPELNEAGPCGLRCYMTAQEDYHFVNYSCDTLLPFSSTTQQINNPSNISFSPNPSTDEVLVSLHQPMEGRWQLVAPSGQVVRAGHWAAAQTTQRIDVSHLSAGVYFFRFVAESGRVVSTRKVVVAR